MSLLEVRNITQQFGGLAAVDNVSIVLNKGEILGLIGPNGASKTTTLKTISGIVRPVKGEIHFNNIPIHKVEPYRMIELGIVHVPEARRLFVEMSVEENLDMGSLKGDAKKEREITKQLVFELFPRLLERRRQLAGTLSGGEQQMLAIGRGLMSKPKLQMFDEPSLGLSPILVKDIFNVIKKIKEEGTTVLIVEQNVKQTLAIADRAYVLENGRIALQGTGAELLNNEHVKTAYLGI